MRNWADLFGSGRRAGGGCAIGQASSVAVAVQEEGAQLGRPLRYGWTDLFAAFPEAGRRTPCAGRAVMLTAVQSLRLACSEGASSEERGAREGREELGLERVRLLGKKRAARTFWGPGG